ncbi:alpha/beta hydrolase [Silvibacterium dinghuense]|uniref:alpha/beta hydrolase n=1 Tax=Silvibacterium dinghuense TaxID=1560006 RepID=UPI0013E8F9DD|nr:alpha/beta fold hydrolase [Silvibacterium dinghuense]GGH10371.1 alpha/beta hydrolase [Silvibacterium dinghuense]
MAKPKSQPNRSTSSAPVEETIRAAWLLKAVLITLAAALFCVYASLCLLFYQGQWQLILHPSHLIAATPAAQGLKFEDVHFDVTETGVSQLDGWWIPADPGSRWSSSAILYLHDGAGSLSDALPTLAMLHDLGVNVFAFDYRGFGRSVSVRPGEQTMQADAQAAWNYLTQTRSLSAQSVVLYGTGLGATPATQLAAATSPAGIILDTPSETARTLFLRDSRSHILPLWLLQNQNFDPEPVLRALAIPKLFLDRDGERPRTRQLFHAAAYPRTYVEARSQIDTTHALQQFFDQVLH